MKPDPHSPHPRVKSAWQCLRGAPLRLVGALLVCSLLSAWGWGDPKVTIRRSEYGIAHIEAKDLKWLAHGMAYAHARDNLCQTADHLVTMRGERSLYFGPREKGYFGLKKWDNMNLDVFVKSTMIKEPMFGSAEGMSRDARDLAKGYVAGYNEYLNWARANPKDAIAAGHTECFDATSSEEKPWLRHMTLDQWLRLTEEISIMLGVGGTPFGTAFIDAVVNADANIPGRAAAALGDPCNPAAEKLLQTAHADPQPPQAGGGGSNGWAFGGEVTRNKSGLVLGNPHFPWTGPLRFWQVHLKSGDLDVMGVAMGNSPIVQIGYNRDVAWTHTVATNKSHVVYRLSLVPGKPTKYIIDGQEHDMKPKSVTIMTPGPKKGTKVPCSKTVWLTHYGPVIVGDRYTWTNDFAYAMRDANLRNLRAIDTWLNIGRAKNVGQIKTALSNLGLQWSNTIAADRHGEVLFASHSATVNLTNNQLDQCEVKSKPVSHSLSWNPVLDGSTRACNWANDPLSPVPGLLAPASLPLMRARDYVLNANDSFWLTHPVWPMSSYPRVVGWVDSPQLLRTRAGITQVQGMPRPIDQKNVQEQFFLNRNHSAELVLPDLLNLCKSVEPADKTLTDACKVLEDWDRTSDADKAGALLFRMFWNTLDKQFSSTPPWKLPFDPHRPVDTPRGLQGEAAVQTQILAALKTAATETLSIGKLNATLGAVIQRRQVRGTDYELHGGTEREGVLNKLECRSNKPGTGYTCGSVGPSYLQVVTFNDDGPVAETLLVYGQSSKTGSEHDFDQLSKYADKAWIKAPFHMKDIERSRDDAKAKAASTGRDPGRYDDKTLP